MRHLIVCSDGTWNYPEQESVTNVRRLYHALADVASDGSEQLRYYQPGVGTSGGLRRRVRGAISGAGLSNNVMSAYHWLTTTYQPGDRIALFGFSRGAYTARSLAGMIAACGLIDTAGSDEPTIWRQVEQLYHRRYRSRSNPDPGWSAGLRFTFDPAHEAEIPVWFIGVWDTVGALGIPDSLGRAPLRESAHRYDFHDVRLNQHIRYARHAVAMDERRGAYAPTLWDEPAPGQDVKQVWFPGSHSDVGGGHRETGLSDGALRWMADEAAQTVGLAFCQTMLDQIRPDPIGELHDDNRGLFGLVEPLLDAVFTTLLEPFFEPGPRAVPLVDPRGAPDPSVHPSVYQRQRRSPLITGPYRQSRVPGPGESVTVPVSAREPWNETSLYLQPGDYAFTATGAWRRGTVWCGPAGAPKVNRWRPVEFARLMSTLIGQGGTIYRFLTRKKLGPGLPGSRREQQMPWMVLVGVVANNAVRHGEPDAEHERILIGAGMSHRLDRGGYFYAFANDIWGFYDDNWGTVQLTVSRAS